MSINVEPRSPTEGAQPQANAFGPDPTRLGEFLVSWLAAWDAHDVDAIASLCTDDVVWEDPIMFGRHAQGQEQIRAFSQMFFAAFPDVRFMPIGPPYVGRGVDGVVTIWRGTGTFSGEGLAAWPPGSRGPSYAPTGRRFDVEGVDIYEFRDMRIRRWRIVYDPLDFSRQLGLMPDPRGLPSRLLALAQRATAPLLRRREASSTARASARRA
jgi:hypothetical protein